MIISIDMKNKVKVFKKRIDDLSNLENDQEKNRLWWESLPMTYKEWEGKDRIPKTKEEFLFAERELLNSKFLSNFDFSKFKGEKVLEIGCGSGAGSCLFAKNGADVTAVDITKQAIEIAKTNAKIQSVKIKALNQDAEKMTLKDNSFDFIFSWGVLHHSKNTIKAFENVSRVLKKGGKGLIMVYNKNSARYYINGFNWLILRGKIFKGYNLKTVQDFYTDGYYHRHFTPRELMRELGKQGLITRRLSITHMGHRMLRFVPRRLEQWIKDNYGWLLVSEFEKV
jgi:ubiquinone/menaquinone biosynthesis C-methylase UbiE